MARVLTVPSDPGRRERGETRQEEGGKVRWEETAPSDAPLLAHALHTPHIHLLLKHHHLLRLTSICSPLNPP